jgi:hypothetical protein
MSTNPSHHSQSPIPGAPRSPTYAQMAGSPPSPSAVGSTCLCKPTKRFDGTYAPPIKKTKTTNDASAPIPANSTPAPAPTAVSAPTRAKPAPRARPTAPANNSGDESSGGSDSESSEAAFLPGSGEDEDGASSGSDVDVILSGDDSVIEVSAPDRLKEKLKGKKKRLKGRKSKGKAKVQLRAAIATIPDAEKEPETDEAELGVYFKVNLLYPSHDKPLIARLRKKWTSFVYSLFDPTVKIGYDNGCCYHSFTCL